MLAGIDEKSLLQAVDTAVQTNIDGEDGLPVPDYVDENVSTKVVKIIQSYKGVVNKMVWRKGEGEQLRVNYLAIEKALAGRQALLNRRSLLLLS